MQSLSSSSQVKAGHTANFVIWVWSTQAASTSVVVHAKVAAAEYVGVPAFSICPDAVRANCGIGSLPVGQADELEATVKVGSKAALGEQVQLYAEASARTSKSFTASATDVVVVSPKVNPSVPTFTLPPTTLPPIAGTGTSPSNPANLFPTISPVPSPSSSSITLPAVGPRPTRTVHAADTSATVPLDARLIGGQLAGLAVLAGAVAIAIARLSLRAPKPHDDDGDKAQK